MRKFEIVLKVLTAAVSILFLGVAFLAHYGGEQNMMIISGFLSIYTLILSEAIK